MKLQALSNPVPPSILPDHIVFSAILKMMDRVFGGSAFGYTLLAVCLLLLQSLYLNFITVRHKLTPRNTYLPAFTYLLLTSIYPPFNYLSEPLLINFFTLGAMDMMLGFNQTSQPRKKIFNAGFILCIPALIQFPALGFVLLFILALVFLRSFNLGEWIVGGLGYFTPVYFFAGILFLADRFEVLRMLPQFGFSFPEQFNYKVYRTGVLSGLVLLLLTGSYAVRQLMPRATIFIRRGWLLVYCYLFVSLGVTVIAVSAVNAEWLIMMPALSLIISQSFYLEKSKRFSNFTFYFSLLLLIFSQLALNK